jgi:O-antigen ligase
MHLLKTVLYAFDKLKLFLLPAALVLFASYAFFQPSLSPDIHFFSIIIFIFCLLYLLLARPSIKVSSPLYWVFAYFILGGVSVFLPISHLASKAIWIDTALSVIAGLVIWVAYREANNSVKSILEKMSGFLCLLLALLILLQNLFAGRFSPRKLEFLRWMTLDLNGWMQKYQELWLLLFMWIAVACFSRFKKKFIYIMTAIVVCGAALFSGYSQNTIIAFIASALFFAFGTIKKKFPEYVLTFCVVGVVIFMPLFSSIMNLSVVAGDKCIPVLKDINTGHLTPRLIIWDYSFHFVLINPITGFGFGSAHNLPGENVAPIAFYQTGEFIGKLNPSLNGALYPGRHPHSAVYLVLIDLGLIGLILYVGFLVSIIVEIARSKVPYWCTNAAGSLLLAVVIYWQLSFSVWDFECLLLLFISSGLMSLMLNTKNADNFVEQERPKLINKLLLVVVATGIILNIVCYAKEKLVFGNIEKAQISLSNDLSEIIINGKNHPISATPGGYYNVAMQKDTIPIFLGGWAGDYLGDNSIQAVFILHNGVKINIIEPQQTRFVVRKRYGKDTLLFSGFYLPVNVPYAESTDYRKFMVIALFRNGEARRLYKVRTVNLE